MRRVCVFCGSSAGQRPEHVVAARALGELAASRSLGLVYGGGNVGLMGAVATAALAAGGEVIGVIPAALRDRELALDEVTELRVVATMHERKAMMAELADGFVALPGGLGTLEELFEVLTWAQLGIHAKPCGLLDVAGYYAQLSAFLDHAVGEGFLHPAHRALLICDTDPAILLDRLAAHEPPAVEKWLDLEQS